MPAVLVRTLNRPMQHMLRHDALQSDWKKRKSSGRTKSVLQNDIIQCYISDVPKLAMNFARMRTLADEVKINRNGQHS